MANFHTIKVKDYPATDKRDRRVGLISLHTGESFVLPNQQDYIIKDALIFLERIGFEIVEKIKTPDGWIIISSTFKSLYDIDEISI